MDDTTKAEIHSLIKEIEARALGHSPDSQQSPFIAKLHVLIAEEESKAAEKVERQTNKLIRLTWALVILTLALFFLTAYLSYDAYLKGKGHEKAEPSATQKQ